MWNERELLLYSVFVALVVAVMVEHLVVVVVVKLQFLLPPLLRTRVLLRYPLQPNSCTGDQQCRRDGRTEYIKIENNYLLYVFLACVLLSCFPLCDQCIR